MPNREDLFLVSVAGSSQPFKIFSYDIQCSLSLTMILPEKSEIDSIIVISTEGEYAS